MTFDMAAAAPALLDALNHAHVGVVVFRVTKTGREKVYANKSLASVLGYTPEEWIATPLYHLIADDQKYAVKQIIDKADHVPDLTAHDFDSAAPNCVIVAAAIQHLEHVAQRRQRVAQFVGERGQKFILASVCVRQIGGKLAKVALQLSLSADVSSNLRSADHAPVGSNDR